MSDKSSTSSPLKDLLWRHFYWHLWVGLAIWTVCAGPFMAYLYWQQRAKVLAEPFYANHLGAALANVTGEYVELSIMLFLCAFVVAVVGSGLRYPALARLSRKVQTRTGLVAISLLVFVLQVVVLSIPPWPIAYNSFGIESIRRQLLVLCFFNLPWLIATGLASYRLAAALVLPPTSKRVRAAGTGLSAARPH